MESLTKADYEGLHAKMGSTKRDETLSTWTDRPVDELTPFERKQEFYGLLKTIASPGVVYQVHDLRERYRLGLVRRDGDALASTIDEPLVASFADAREKGNPLEVADLQYRTMRRTLEIAGELWQEAMVREGHPGYRRMDELMEPEMRAKYGEKPVSRRVASATAQTVSVGLGVQELAARLYPKKFGRAATPDHLRKAHTSGLRIAMLWADFNRHQLLSLEKKIRILRTDHEGIEPLGNEEAFDIAEDGTVTFTSKTIIDQIAGEKVHMAEGRFGCPGKKYIPQLWEWTEEVSTELGLLRE